MLYTIRIGILFMQHLLVDHAERIGNVDQSKLPSRNITCGGREISDCVYRNCNAHRNAKLCESNCESQHSASRNRWYSKVDQQNREERNQEPRQSNRNVAGFRKTYYYFFKGKSDAQCFPSFYSVCDQLFFHLLTSLVDLFI